MKLLSLYFIVVLMLSPINTSYSDYKKENIQKSILTEMDVINMTVDKYAKENNLDPLLVHSVIIVESQYNVTAVSKEGCLGLMQINAPVHKELLTSLKLKKNDLFRIEPNIKVGTIVLKNYIKENHNSILLGLKHYNGAKNLRYANKVMRNYRNLKNQ